MSNNIVLKKGLNIPLAGVPALVVKRTILPDTVAVQPSDYKGLNARLLVREGDKVLAGSPVLADKKNPDVLVTSPVSGTVKAVVRGDKRKLLAVLVDADKDQEYLDFGAAKDGLSAEDVKDRLLKSGLWTAFVQRPYGIVADPAATPKAIFVSALRDKPLAGDFEFEVKGQEQDFQTGLTALSKIAKTYLGCGVHSSFENYKDVEVNIFDGKCPAGNVGVQVNHIDPVNKGEVVWTIGDPTVVLFIGRLFNTGKVCLKRRIALCGSEVKAPAYVDMLVGEELSTLLSNSYDADRHVRIINGNVLTGRPTTKEGFLGAHTSEITVIPEGDDADEFLGWILPRFNQFSVNRSYFSWLFGKKKYALDARIKGGERHMIMSGEYDKVLPMDIYGEYLIKAIITGDIDRQEALGIYEVAPEDFALAEFVDSSKLELQRIVREGLNILRKENA